MTVITSHLDSLVAEVVELRKLRDAHEAQWKALSRQAEAGARDAALWRSQFEDAQRMLEQLRGELGRERGLRVNAVAALKIVLGSPVHDNGVHDGTGRTVGDVIRAVIAEAERHG